MKKLSPPIAALAAVAVLAACGSARPTQQAQGPCQTRPADIHAARAYAYEVATDPAHPGNDRYWPPGNNDAWGWMPRTERLRAGGLICVDRRYWRIAAIERLPGSGKPFGILGWNGRATPVLQGRLVLRPAAD